MASILAYRRFWSLVWPHLEAGTWRYDLQPGPEAGEASADHSDVGTAAAAKGVSADLNGDGGVGSSSGCDSSCGSASLDSRSGGDIPEKIGRPRSRGVRGRGSRGICSRRREDTVPLPIFFPPAVGVASEGLELALHRDPPPDGEATSGDRIERLEGIDAVVELLQRVPGYPGTSCAGSVPSMDAVAAAARAVLVPPVARREEQVSLRKKGASTPSGYLAAGPDVAKADTERPLSSSYSSLSSSAFSGKNDSPKATRFVGGQIVRRRPPNVQGSAPQMVSPPSVDGKDASEVTDPATTTSRTGRAIKKPVRLEDQEHGRQMMTGRSGRADALGRTAAREVAARAATLCAGASASPAIATSSAADRERPSQLNGMPETSSAEVNFGQEKKRGAERCIARLGTSFGGGETAAQSSPPPDFRGWHEPSWVAESGSSGLGKRSKCNGYANGTNASCADVSSNGGINSSGGISSSIATKEDVSLRGALSSGACKRDTTVGLAEQAVAVKAPVAAGAVGCNVSEDGGGGAGSKKAGWGGHLIVPHPPPPRPVGMGYNPEETIKEYKRSFDDVIWPGLENEHGWKKAYGPRNNDAYYLPRGVERGKNGARCRLDFFDSYKQVIEHMVDKKSTYDDLLERAWAQSITKPRAISKKSGATGRARRKKSWTDISRRKTRKSNMMTPEHPKKVSAVGKNHQVDPKQLCPAVSSEEYNAPEDVLFEQVWDPKVLMPCERLGRNPQDPNDLVQEFAGSVSHDKCLEILYRCGGDYYQARLKLLHILRLWNAQFPEAMAGTKHLAGARAAAERELATRMTEWKIATGSTEGSPQNRREGPPEDSEPEFVTRVTHWSGGNTIISSRKTSIAVDAIGGGGGGGKTSCQKVWTAADEQEFRQNFWTRPTKHMLTGEWALKRQIEGGIPTAAPEAAGGDKLPPDLNLSHPWTQSEAQTYTRAMVEHGTKDFHAVQKALPNRQICELVDRYYAGWKETEGYKQLKEKILRSKRQAACWVCNSGGDLICCDGCEGVYHVECAHLPQVPEGDWFCATCSGGNAAGEPGSSACSSVSEPSSGYAAAVVSDAAVRSDGAKNGATTSGDMTSRAGKTAENEGEGSSSAVTSNAQLGPTISDNSKGDILPSKRQHTPDESCGNGGWDEAGESHQNETASRNKKMRKKSGSSRRVRSGATWRATEAHGLERVPIYLGPARSVTDGASGSSRVPFTSTASAVTRLPAASAAEIEAEDLPASSAVLNSCGSSSSEGPENSKPSRAAQETVIVVSPVVDGGEAAGRRQSTSSSEVAHSTFPLTHAPCPALASPARAPAPARARALVRTVAGVAPSFVPTANSSPPARAPSGELDVSPGPVNASDTDDPQLDEEGAAEVDVGGVFEAGSASEATEASWECRCCNRRNCGNDRGCRECGASRPMGGGARAARRDGKRSRVQRNQRTPPTYKPEKLNAPARSAGEAAAMGKNAGEGTARGKNAGEGTALPPSRWVCRACATYNKMNRVCCSTCSTKNQRKAVEGGKPEWWCCSLCSRFNSRCQDGNRCRFCKVGAPAEEHGEDEEEVSSYKPEKLNAPASSAGEAVARGKNTGEGTALPLSRWVCPPCTAYKMNRDSCSICLTKNQRKAVEGGKPEWWCCSLCSRFNSRCKDGNRCRFCKVGAPAEEQEEDEEEVISVGEEEGLSAVMPNGGSERIAVRLPPA